MKQKLILVIFGLILAVCGELTAAPIRTVASDLMATQIAVEEPGYAATVVESTAATNTMPLAAEPGTTIQLPPPMLVGDVSLEEALANRRSVRAFEDLPLTEAELGQLLWAGQGITDEAGHRTAPSAGALYPLELFVATEEGVFHYDPQPHQLIVLSTEDARMGLYEASGGQQSVGQAPAVFVVTAVYERTTSQFGEERGARYVDHEAGHATQNMLLEATALGLGAVSVGGFDATDAQQVLALPADHQPLYLVPVGHISVDSQWYVAPGGDDSDTCASPTRACATINGAIGKAGSLDTIYVAGGTYYGSGNEVVLLDKSLTLSGGWDGSFSERNEESVIDGLGERVGVRVAEDAVAIMDSFAVQNCLDRGIFNAGTLTVVACDVRSNTGSGIDNRYGTLTVRHSRVRDNISGGDGVGLFNGNGMMTIDHSLVSGNVLYAPGQSGGGGGAGIFNPGGSLVVRDSTISRNSIVGGFYGSAIAGGGVAIINSTISGNVGGGGAIYDSAGQYHISSSTITDNEGGLVNIGGVIRLRDTLLAGNTGLDCYHDDNYPGAIVQSLGYSLIGTLVDCTTSGTDLTGVDPRLLPLKAGFHTLPTHALLPSSPAFNGGDPAGCTDHLGNPLDADQRGLPRFGRCDIGAYELQPIAFSAKTVRPFSVMPGDSLTYTISLTNGGSADLATVRVTDTLAISLTYKMDSLTATSGSYGYSSGVITWMGSLTAGNETAIKFGATVPETTALYSSITNSAIISGGGEVFTRTARLKIGIYDVYLPCIMRD